MKNIRDFVSQLVLTFKTGVATEHSYRSSFESLFKSLDKDVIALNEPKRVQCGAPDFIIQRNGLVVGHLEAKDLGVDIRNISGYGKEQKKRYLDALPNLIYSNGLDWDFFRDGRLVESVTIGTLGASIELDESQYEKLAVLLADFISQLPISISRPKELAERMAGKAKLIKSILYNALADDLSSETDSDLAYQYATFQENLIHDIEPEGFADIYAETICYGMFAARLHDDSLETFSRHEALDKLPKTNPFLKNLFSYVAGPGLDDRIAWIIDDLADIFRATDVASIMAGFGKLAGREDPFLHFYETFLSSYNPDKRKSRGVWYTPEPVVNFIVRAVDKVLQTEFGLVDGLADTSKVKIQWDTGQKKLTKQGKPTADGKNAIVEKDVHRVQVLDPATGTGTFLAEVVKLIAPKIKGVAPGMWSDYIEKDLMPRIHGFELLMASYAMCHMKLDMVLTELGYIPSSMPPRQSVYLTNSLEEGDPPNYELPFARWLANEVKMANTIKRDMPIMCVIGNPPYSGISQNMGDWIVGLIEDYKYVDGDHFGERKHWLHDDYVKFIRLAEELINKNGEGVLGFITNHGYLDNPTFRGMRWHLMNTFEKIWILDLHGNTKKKEVDPLTGKPDKNVFDIMQGVAVIIGIKKRSGGGQLAEVRHADVWGERSQKYRLLSELDLTDDVFKLLDIRPPRYPFVPRDWSAMASYNKGFAINEFMPINSTGIVTARDSLVIDFTTEELKEKIRRFVDCKKSDDQVRAEFFPNKKSGKYQPGDSRGWKLPVVRKSLQGVNWEEDVMLVSYRPFDSRAILYRPDMVDWGRFGFMRHMLAGPNIALLTTKAHRDDAFAHVSVCQTISEVIGLSPRTASNSVSFPLYLYPEGELRLSERRINFNPELYARMTALAKHSDFGVADEVSVFDYIYGALHSPVYRANYSEFLKADFPRIPWPAGPDEFWKVSSQGSALRKLHLMDPDAVGETPYTFEGDGDNVVGAISTSSFRDGRVWVNETQFFSNIPENAWNFYVGGYQPAQKWLKDRRGRALRFDDVRHYQRIIKVLIETDRIMGQINLELDVS